MLRKFAPIFGLLLITSTAVAGCSSSDSNPSPGPIPGPEPDTTSETSPDVDSQSPNNDIDEDTSETDKETSIEPTQCQIDAPLAQQIENAELSDSSLHAANLPQNQRFRLKTQSIPFENIETSLATSLTSESDGPPDKIPGLENPSNGLVTLFGDEKLLMHSNSEQLIGGSAVISNIALNGEPRSLEGLETSNHFVRYSYPDYELSVSQSRLGLQLGLRVESDFSGAINRISMDLSQIYRLEIVNGKAKLLNENQNTFAKMKVTGSAHSEALNPSNISLEQGYNSSLSIALSNPLTNKPIHLSILISPVSQEGHLITGQERLKIGRGKQNQLLFWEPSGFQSLYQVYEVDRHGHVEQKETRFEEISRLWTVDLNGDELTDVITRDSESDENIIYLQQSNGDFARAMTFETESTQFGFGYFNADDHLDLYVAHSKQRDEIWVGDGEGMLQSGTLVSYPRDTKYPNYSVNDIHIADFNGDRRDDIIVSTEKEEESFRIYFGQPNESSPYFGNGSGAAPNVDHLKTANVIGGPPIDIVSSSPERLQIWENTGDGELEKAPSLPFSEFNDFALGQVNENNRMALIALGPTSTQVYSIDNSDSLNQIDSLESYGATQVGSLKFSDSEFNDLVIADSRFRSALRIYRNNQRNEFTPANFDKESAHQSTSGDGNIKSQIENIVRTSCPASLQSCPLTGYALANRIDAANDAAIEDIYNSGEPGSAPDGRLDIYVATDERDLLLEQRPASFNKTWSSNASGNVLDVELADIDGDTIREALVLFASRLLLFDRRSNGDWEQIRQFTSHQDAADLEVADLNGDNQLEFWITSREHGPLVWQRSQSSGRYLFGFSAETDAPKSAEVTLADFNADGLKDAFVTKPESENELWLNKSMGSGLNFKLSDVEIGDRNDTVASGDLNGDGAPDLIVDGHIWLNQSRQLDSISFQKRGSLGQTGDSVTDIEMKNVDSQPGLDVLMTRNNQQSNLWINDGSANFEKRKDLGQRSSYGELADVTGDGSIDIVTSGQDDSLFANNGNGRFSKVNAAFEGVELSEFEAKPIDMTNSQRADIFGGFSEQTIGVLKNKGASFETVFSTDRSGPSRAVAAGDFIACDGKSDIALITDEAVLSYKNTPGRDSPPLQLASRYTDDSYPLSDIQIGEFNSEMNGEELATSNPNGRHIVWTTDCNRCPKPRSIFGTRISGLYSPLRTKAMTSGNSNNSLETVDVGPAGQTKQTWHPK